MEPGHPMLTDPESIALESLRERTRHFIFGDDMLESLHERGLVEPAGEVWTVTADGQQALEARLH